MILKLNVMTEVIRAEKEDFFLLGDVHLEALGGTHY